MKYVVHVRYLKFEFKDGDQALMFAKMARCAISEEDRKDDITIVLVNAENSAENKED